VVRVLLEANEYNVLGLIATDDGGYLADRTLHDMIDAYEKVYPNLIKHADGYPTAAYLRSVVATGNDRHAPTKLTDGAKLIIRQVDATKGPVWVMSWGSTTTLAKAVKEVQATRTTAQLNAFVSKIRLYEAYGQCSNGQWLAQNFPNMIILRDSPLGGNYAVNWTERLNNSPYDRNYADDTWHFENIVGKGPLGDPDEFKFGDASFNLTGGNFRIRRHRWASDSGGVLHLLSGRYGLHDPEQPTQGGWGGRFNSIKTRNPGPLNNSDGRPVPPPDYYILTPGHDTYAGENNLYITTARWRKAVQNDFLARMNWSVASTYGEANHPPVAKVDGSLTRTVTSGAVVNLSAAGSTDPDPLTYRWWHYPEPGTYKKTLEINGADAQDASFVAPDVASTQTIHIILEVTDTGTPPLTRYQRVIVTVNPGSNPPAQNPAPVIYDSPWAWQANPQVRPSNVSDFQARYARKSQTLHVVAGYEDRPANPGEFTYTWAQVSGPGTVSFDITNGTANGDICDAVFPDPPEGCVKYELSVTVSNGTHSITAPLTFVLTGTSPGNPGAPKVTATAVSSSRINLSWGNVGRNYGYRITRRLGTVGKWTDVAEVAQNVTSYSDTGLSAGTTYYYRVQTLGPRFNSVGGNLVNATTQVAEPVPAFMNPPEYVGPAIGEWAVTNRSTHMVSSMAVTPGGRLWVTWYVSMTGGENEHNYVVLSTSGDDGATWEEVLVIDPDGPGPVRAFDPEIWISPDGKLRVYWAQAIGHDGAVSGTWEIVTADPESSSPKWSPPRRLADGIMMCKPIALSTGEWALPISTWRHTDYSAQMVVSSDKGETWKVRGAANVPVEMRNFDEHMFIERRDGSIWMLVRTRYNSGWTVRGHRRFDTPGINGIGESISTDRGVTWPEVTPLTNIPHPNARFFITRLQSDNLLLVKHGPMDERLEVRSHLMAFISRDDGQTWQGGLLLDEREGISYPDGQQADDGTVYITYDRDRSGAREILFATFREEDALAGEAVTDAVRLRQLVSKGSGGLRNPANARASASSSSQINLSWSDRSSHETGFIIERRTGTSGTWDQIATVGANITSFNDTGLSAGTQYFYRVRAYSNSSLGNSRYYSRQYSNEANATTQGARHPNPIGRD